MENRVSLNMCFSKAMRMARSLIAVINLSEDKLGFLIALLLQGCVKILPFFIPLISSREFRANIDANN